MKIFYRYILPHIPFIGLVCVFLDEDSGIDVYERPITYFSSMITQIVGMMLLWVFFRGAGTAF
jgi:hypothetical protein